MTAHSSTVEKKDRAEYVECPFGDSGGDSFGDSRGFSFRDNRGVSSRTLEFEEDNLFWMNQIRVSDIIFTF